MFGWKRHAEKNEICMEKNNPMNSWNLFVCPLFWGIESTHQKDGPLNLPPLKTVSV